MTGPRPQRAAQAGERPRMAIYVVLGLGKAGFRAFDGLGIFLSQREAAAAIMQVR